MRPRAERLERPKFFLEERIARRQEMMARHNSPALRLYYLLKIESLAVDLHNVKRKIAKEAKSNGNQ